MASYPRFQSCRMDFELFKESSEISLARLLATRDELIIGGKGYPRAWKTSSRNTFELLNIYPDKSNPMDNF